MKLILLVVALALTGCVHPPPLKIVKSAYPSDMTWRMIALYPDYPCDLESMRPLCKLVHDDLVVVMEQTYPGTQARYDAEIKLVEDWDAMDAENEAIKKVDQQIRETTYLD